MYHTIAFCNVTKSTHMVLLWMRDNYSFNSMVIKRHVSGQTI